MKPQTIPQTVNTPFIRYESDAGRLIIEGKSTPNDPVDFYGKLLDWIRELEKNPEFLQEIDIKLTYMNTGTSKWIFHIFKEVESLRKDEGKVTINWYYEEDDESMQEMGEDYKTMLNLPVNLIPQVEMKN